MLVFLIHFAVLFALALWVGGGVGIAFLAAPAVFEHAGSRQKAGELVGHILRRFDTVALAAGSVALVGSFLELFGTVGPARGRVLQVALIAAMLALALYARSAPAPQRAFCLMGQMVLGALAMGLAVM